MQLFKLLAKPLVAPGAADFADKKMVAGKSDAKVWLVENQMVRAVSGYVKNLKGQVPDCNFISLFQENIGLVKSGDFCLWIELFNARVSINVIVMQVGIQDPIDGESLPFCAFNKQIRIVRRIDQSGAFCRAVAEEVAEISVAAGQMLLKDQVHPIDEVETHPFRGGRKPRSLFLFLKKNSINYNLFTMHTRTICCKLLTNQEFEDALQETSIQFAHACNYALKAAISGKISNAIKLHHLCYQEIRKLFNLSANLAVRAIHRVAGCMKALKGKRKRPKEFKPRSVSYDARIFSYFEGKEMVSLTTTRGRLKIPLCLGERQRSRLQGKKPTAATLLNIGGAWYLHISIEITPLPCAGSNVMGIDLGIVNIATTSTGQCIEGQSRRRFKEKRERIRASLQSKGSPGAKKLLKKLSGKESRRIKYENHVLAKQLVEEAKRHECGIIRMEQLKAIRARTKTWNKHRNREVAGWSFYQLQQFVSYKAAAFGITIELIDPAYTSQTCHRCLKLGSRKGEQFNCLTCGKEHADVNASRVIALGGAVCKPAWISSFG